MVNSTEMDRRSMAYFVIVVGLIACSSEVFGSNQGTEAPRNIQGVYIQNLDLIVTCWEHVKNSTHYEVFTKFPDLTTQYLNISEPAFVLENVGAGPSGYYTFKVRRWDGIRYSGFSQEVLVSVEAEKVNMTNVTNGTKAVESMKFVVDANETSTFTWEDAPKEFSLEGGSLTPFSCLTFTMQTCLRVGQYREWTTNESFVMDVRILEHINKETNRTETLYLKQQTIHYDQVHTELLGYANVSCQSVTSRQMTFGIQGLLKGYNYTYWVKVYLGQRLLGTFDEGDFTGTGYVPPVIVFVEVIAPIEVYLLTCCALTFILLTAFAMSLAFGWDRVMNDLYVRKDKMRKQKELEMYEEIKGKMLTESFINNQTRQQTEPL